MEKYYNNVSTQINKYPKSTYQLYFNSRLKNKWVNSSRSKEDMVEEILKKEYIPHYINYAYITVESENTIKETIWEREKEGRKIVDTNTGEVYKSIRLASLDTGVLINTIISHCNSPLHKKRRFKYK